MIKLKNKIIVIITLVISLCLFNINASRVLAIGRSLDNQILNKALYTALKICYKNDFLWYSIDFNQYNDGESILRGSGKREDQLSLPNGYTKIEDNNISCSQLLSGYNIGKDKNSFDGLYNMSGISMPGIDRKSVENFYYSMGYEDSDNNTSSTGECVAYNYTVIEKSFDGAMTRKESTKSVVTPALCSGPLDNGNITVLTLYSDDTHSDDSIVKFKNSKNKIDIQCGGSCKHDVEFSNGESWNSIKKKILKAIGDNQRTKYFADKYDSEFTGRSHSKEYIMNSANPEVITKLEDHNKVYVLKDYEKSSEKAAKTLMGANKPSSEKFSNWEEMALYYTYLKDIYKSEVVCDIPNGESGKDILKSQGMKEVKLYNNGKLSNCLIKTQNPNIKVNGLLYPQMTFGASMSFDDIIGRLNTHTTENLPSQYGDYDWSGNLS